MGARTRSARQHRLFA
jgi:hypothetical protein